MKPKYSYALVVIVLTVITACQMVKLPFLKDKSENKVIETPQADDRQNNLVAAPAEQDENMDSGQPGIAENGETSHDYDTQGNYPEAQDKPTENMDTGQPGIVESGQMAEAGDSQANDTAPQALEERAGDMEPSPAADTENTERLDKELPTLAEANSHISRSYVELGRAYLNARQIGEAKRAFQRAMDYDENCQDCPALLSQCCQIEGEALRIKGEKLIRDKQFDDAAKLLEQALALNSDDAAASNLLFQAHYQKALHLYDKGNYLEAKDGFEKAMAVKPDCTDCKPLIEDSLDKYKERHYSDGISYFGQEDLKQAISSWEKVVAVDPDYKNVRENLKKAILMNERIEMIKQHSGK